MLLLLLLLPLHPLPLPLRFWLRFSTAVTMTLVTGCTSRSFCG
jgi:hypothetical protein